MPAFSVRTPLLTLICISVALCATGCSSSSTPSNAPEDTKTSKTPAVSPGESARPFVELPATIIAENLDTPAGLAIQPVTGDIFVATVQGIVRLDADDNFAAHPEIIGFPKDMYGAGPTYNFGPLGLGFLDESTLVVGGGGASDGEDVIRFFTVGNAPLPEPMNADSALHSVGPIAEGEQSHRGEGNYFGLHIHDGTVFVTSHGDDTQGWVSRIKVIDQKPEGLEPFLPSKTFTDTDGPSGIAFLPDGSMLVSQTGELHERPDSVLAVVDLSTGEFVRKIETGLFDVTKIVVHPSSQKLFALDFAWATPGEGGLFTLDIDSDEKAAVVTKHAALVHPAAIAITDSGELIVACVGHQDENPKPQGTIHRISLE